MTPLYLLLAVATLIIVAMLVSVLRGRGTRLRGEPFERRPLLSADELRCYRMISEAAGDAYRVCPKVAALSLLRPLPRMGRDQRRLAQGLLAEGWADLLICAASDLYPLAVVRLLPAKSDRAQRRIVVRLRAAFAAAGMPVIELTVGDLPSVERLRGLVAEAIAMADVRLVARAEPASGEDEDALLSDLAAAMRDPDGRVSR
ncbi:DUF2726 domain-containing protein [Lamprobacter modestohalophilus]|uniref:DUF2726 domain-containing protein n=1 Tax=Lamprobacter modestohalophilus TaxID=1064514 RepID=UPI002ADEB7E0|nr:DUF2726 domain-containing protein [Lamprobacter modestohalophilus]MEA1049878.1 DUF2726 domain-containing protein [Lamprobacter modestohalophilus]